MILWGYHERYTPGDNQASPQALQNWLAHVRKTGSSVCLFLILAGVGSVPRTIPSARTKFNSSTPKVARQHQLSLRLTRAYDLLSAGEYLKAIPIYEDACPTAEALTQDEWAGRCWNNLASSYFSIFRYREQRRASR